MRKLVFESLDCRTMMAFGDVDSLFGENGFVQIANQKSIASTAQADWSLLLEDGKRVLFGSSVTGSGIHASMAKFMPDGSLDASFGKDGKVVLQEFRFWDVEMVPGSGKFLVAIGEIEAHRLARINADGSIDTSFGTNGYLHGIEPRTIQFSTDGSFYVVSDNIPNLPIYRVTKFHPNGTKNLAFGNEGQLDVFTDGATSFDKIRFDELGRLYVSRYFYGDPSANHFQIRRFSAEGIQDNGFGDSGTLDIPLSKDGLTVSGWVLTKDSILVASQEGQYDKTASHYKFNLDGKPDESFGIGGKFTYVFQRKSGLNETAISIELREDGTFRVAGRGSDYPAPEDSLVWSYVLSPQGVLDTNYGNEGFAKSLTKSIQVLRLTPRTDNETELVGFVRNASGGIEMSSKKLDASGAITDWISSPDRFQANFAFLGSAVSSFNLVNNGIGCFVGQDGQYLRRLTAGMNPMAAPTLQVTNTYNVDYQSDSLGNIYALAEAGEDALVKYKAGTMELDSSFGTNGRIVLDGFNLRMSVGTDAILFWSELPNGQLGTRFRRFDLGGEIDTSFGIDGTLIIEDVKSVAGKLGNNGELVYVSVNRVTGDAFVQAMDRRGRNVDSFAPFRVSSDSSAHTDSQIAFDSRQRILVKIGSQVMRLGFNGELDESFATNGVFSWLTKLATTFNNHQVTMAVYGDRVALVGRDQEDPEKILVTSLLEGRVENDFGDRGIASVRFQGYSAFDRVQWLPDASLLLSALTSNVLESFGTVVRLQGPGVNPRPKHNVFMPLNADNDAERSVTPLDALVIVNELNQGPTSVGVVGHLTDVDADGVTSPLDLLIVINFLNRRMRGEGEGLGRNTEIEKAASLSTCVDWIWQKDLLSEEWQDGSFQKSGFRTIRRR